MDSVTAQMSKQIPAFGVTLECKVGIYAWGWYVYIYRYIHTHTHTYAYNLSIKSILCQKCNLLPLNQHYPQVYGKNEPFWNIFLQLHQDSTALTPLYNLFEHLEAAGRAHRWSQEPSNKGNRAASISSSCWSQHCCVEQAFCIYCLDPPRHLFCLVLTMERLGKTPPQGGTVSQLWLRFSQPQPEPCLRKTMKSHAGLQEASGMTQAVFLGLKVRAQLSSLACHL